MNFMFSFFEYLFLKGTRLYDAENNPPYQNLAWCVALASLNSLFWSLPQLTEAGRSLAGAIKIPGILKNVVADGAAEGGKMFALCVAFDWALDKAGCWWEQFYSKNKLPPIR